MTKRRQSIASAAVLVLALVPCAGATSLDDGRFKLELAIEDSSVYAEDQTAPNAPKLSGIPTFRSFTSIETLILKDGQSSQFTASTDKISGEVTRVDVTLTVVK